VAQTEIADTAKINEYPVGDRGCEGEDLLIRLTKSVSSIGVINLILKLSALSPKQLIEIDACTRCGECLKYCPVYAHKGEEAIDPRGKIQAFKSFIRSQYGLWAKIFGPKKLDEEKLKKFSEMVYRCTLCGECSVSCPVSIDSKSLWTALRKPGRDGPLPEAAKRMKANVLDAHNVSVTKTKRGRNG
jgi:Fe-S oxidoreductase